MILKVLPGKASSDWRNRNWASSFPGRGGQGGGRLGVGETLLSPQEGLLA